MMQRSASRLAPRLVSGLALCLLLLSGCSQDIDERLAHARDLQQKGDPEQALAELRSIVDQHPDHPEANYRLGLALIASGQRGAALFPLHRAAATDEFAVDAGIAEASLLLQTSNGIEAQRAAELVLAREPENEVALMLLAEAALAEHDGAKALSAADRLIEANPASKQYQLTRASALGHLARWDEAEKLFSSLSLEPWEDDAQGADRACFAYAKYFQERRSDKESAKRVIADCTAKRPDDVPLAVGAARSYATLGDPDAGIAHLRKMLERFPDDRALRQALSETLLEADRFAEADSLVTEVAEEQSDADAWRSVSVVRRRAGDVEGALAAAEKALTFPAGQSGDEPLFLKADLLVELGRLDEAEAAAKNLTTVLFENVIEGRLAQERGDARRALDLLGAAIIEWPNNYGLRVLAARAAMDLRDVERARSELLEATRQAPKETDAALWLSRLYFAQGDYDLAYEFAARHINLRGVRNPAGHIAAARALLAKGSANQAMVMLQELGQKEARFLPAAISEATRITAQVSGPQAALEFADDAIARKRVDLSRPDAEPLLRQIAELEVASGRAGQAYARVTRLRDQQPDRAPLHALHGRIALAAGKPDVAEKDFARALELAPKNAEAHAGRGALLQARGDLQGALAEMKQALAAAANPDYGYTVAHLHFALGEAAQGREALERVLRDFPDHAPSANDLAYRLAESGESLERANELATLATRTLPSAETFDTLGYVLYKQGKHDQAVPVFERALAKQPGYATARFHLALALIGSGKADAARTALKSALDAGSFPEREQAEQELARLDATGSAQ